MSPSAGSEAHGGWSLWGVPAASLKCLVYILEICLQIKTQPSVIVLATSRGSAAGMSSLFTARPRLSFMCACPSRSARHSRPDAGQTASRGFSPGQIKEPWKSKCLARVWDNVEQTSFHHLDVSDFFPPQTWTDLKNKWSMELRLWLAGRL